MSPPPPRRAFVAGASLSLLSLAGCLSGADIGAQPDSRTTTAERCQVAKSSISARSVRPSAERREHMVPVEFDEQTDAVREVFELAVEGESVSGACPTKTPTNGQERAVSAALDVVRDALAAQQRQYGPDPPKWLRQTAYLRKDSEFYYLLVMLSDTMLTTD
jgi:hypothetical protein